jgi:hypothetical protein
MTGQHLAAIEASNGLTLFPFDQPGGTGVARLHLEAKGMGEETANVSSLRARMTARKLLKIARKQSL